MSKKHMTLEDRYTIYHMLNEGDSFKKIADATHKNCTSVSREIKNHLVFKKTGAYSHPFNECIHRKGCPQTALCSHCTYKVRKRCSFCSKCNSVCPDFQAEKCSRLQSPPYVCNACPDLKNCTLEKRYYKPLEADKEYRAVLSESRTGISYSEEEIKHLDQVISPLIRKGQSINHICANNKDSLMVSESTKYCQDHPDLPVTKMDTVEGTKGGKVLLTLHFVKAELMIAFLRDSNDSQSVIDIFEKLYIELRCDVFMNLMPIIITDYAEEKTMPKFLRTPVRLSFSTVFLHPQL